MGIENRKEKRVPLQKEVLINGSIKAEGLDLSMGGLYVHTGRQFTAGLVVNLSMPLNAKYINLQARVQHAQESVGMGLKFVNMSAEQEADLQAYIDSAYEAYSSHTKKTVLLVDDNESSRRMNKSRLILDGFSVLEAKDGVEASAVLRKGRVDLVVLDLYLQQLDGFELLAIIRQREETRNIPVLVFSARSSSDIKKKAAEAGATEFLVRMMTPPLKLSQRVKAYLSEDN